MDVRPNQNKKDGSRGESGEGGLLLALTEAVGRLGAARCSRGQRGGSAGGTRRGREEEEEGECERRALRVLREISVSHSSGAAKWREALRGCACTLSGAPAGGDHRPCPPTADDESDVFCRTFLSIVEDIENVAEKLESILTKLDEQIHQLDEEQKIPVNASLPSSTAESQEEQEEASNHLNSHDAPGPEVEGRGSENKDDQNQSSDAGPTSTNTSDSFVLCNGGQTGPGVDGQGGVNESPSLERGVKETKKDKKDEEWTTVGLAGRAEDAGSGSPDACLVRAAPGVAEALRCEAADALSFLMVSGSEELVSGVVRVAVRDGFRVRLPVTFAVPFSARYRGNYRTIAVKVVDGDRRTASYINPVTTEGTYGGQRGSFAEVKVYSLGLFAVVSCLKRESYTIPKQGFSHKLPVDPRICLNYLPGSFTSPVVAQSMIQPLDAAALAAVKSGGDGYHRVASTSPLLYLTHPSSQALRRPLTITLPCPPNPDKKKDTRGRGEQKGQRTQTVSDPPMWDQLPSNGMRMLSSTVQSSKQKSSELLAVLGWKDKQWGVLEGVAVRNQQNGLVTFDLTETLGRVLVVRLVSPVQPCHLASLAAELEETSCRHAVTIVLRRRLCEPHAVLAAALPSRELGSELPRMQAQGYDAEPLMSPEIAMREGEQLLLRLSGNITSTGALEPITFHSQRRNQLALRLSEVDPFGNHSSPHYKGTAAFYKVAGGRAGAEVLGDPVCKLPLTLPKKVRSVKHPIMPRVKLCEDTDFLSDSLLLWLSVELSAEEAALLASSLRLRRSAAHLAERRAGGSPSARAFHLLAAWRRELPAAGLGGRAAQLARGLARSGRPDLARELLLRRTAAPREGSEK